MPKGAAAGTPTPSSALARHRLAVARRLTCRSDGVAVPSRPIHRAGKAARSAEDGPGSSRPGVSSLRQLLQPHALEAHHAVGYGGIALHFGAEGFGLDRVDDEHGRGFFAQDLDDLRIELLALGVIRDDARLLEQLVHLGI